MFLRDAADSKQLHTAKAAADGLLAAYLTAEGLSGAKNILEGEQGMAPGLRAEAVAPDGLVEAVSVEFSQGIAEALPGQHFGIQPLFLLVAAIDPQHFECIKVLLSPAALTLWVTPWPVVSPAPPVTEPVPADT